MNECDKLRIKHARLLGEFQGILESLTMGLWELPEELVNRLKITLAQVEKSIEEFEKE
jgi:hypothetical protein